jgi:hypothetical protein
MMIMMCHAYPSTGNAMIDPKTQFLSFMAMATKNRYNSKTLADRGTLENLKNGTEACQQLTEACQQTGNIGACRRAKNFCFVKTMRALTNSGVNIFDIRHRCSAAPNASAISTTPSYCYGPLFPHVASVLDDFKTRNKLLLPLTVRLKAFSSSLMAQLQLQTNLRGALKQVLPYCMCIHSTALTTQAGAAILVCTIHYTLYTILTIYTTGAAILVCHIAADRVRRV